MVLCKCNTFVYVLFRAVNIALRQGSKINRKENGL
jgi:hypothetical protein